MLERLHLCMKHRMKYQSPNIRRLCGSNDIPAQRLFMFGHIGTDIVYRPASSRSPRDCCGIHQVCLNDLGRTKRQQFGICIAVPHHCSHFFAGSCKG